MSHLISLGQKKCRRNSEFKKAGNIVQPFFVNMTDFFTLTNYRKFGTPTMKRTALNKSVKPIDVTRETKEIIKEVKLSDDQKFSLEINGITLTFALKNLKLVLEAIQNG